MRGAIILSVAALFCGLARVSEATTCTTTKNTCKASKHMLATCTNGKCDCNGKFEAGPFGCQKKQKATITADFTLNVEKGATATLKCSAGIGAATYKWTIDNKKNTETGPELTLDTKTASNKEYKCTSNIAGIESDESDPFKVNVGADATKFPKPTVTGMPKKAVDGTVIKFTCETVAKYTNLKYEWTLDGAAQTGNDKTYIYKLDGAKSEGKKLKCSVKTGIDSDDVTFPASFDGDINGVKIDRAGPINVQVGQDVTLLCQQTGDFPNPDSSDTTIKYKWTKDAGTTAVATTSTLSLKNVQTTNAGLYKCQSNNGVLTAKTSPNGVQVNVKNTLVKKPIVPSANVLLNKGYFSLTCDIGSQTKTVTYKWFKDNVELQGVTDNILQFNDAAAADFDGGYTCQATIAGDGSVTSDSFKVELQDPIANIVTVEIKVNNVAVTTLKPVAGTKVTLTCDVSTSKSAGPVTYVWKNGATPVTGNKDIYEVTAGVVNSTPLKITCEATSNSETKISAVVTVTPVAKPEKPSLTFDPKSPVTRGTKVVLGCVSASHGNGATFEWSKNGKTMTGVTSATHTIKKVAKTDDGDYTCKMTIGGQTSDASDAAKLITVADGKTCSKPSECKEPNMNATICIGGKCQCNSGFDWDGEKCSGSVAVMGSLLMIVCAIITHRMF